VKGKMLLFVHIGVGILLAACTCPVSDCPLNATTAVSSSAPASQGHPQLTEQEQLIACSQCHQDVTPAITEEWFNSTHGIANVKCYQCHGTFEDMRTTPDLTRCAVCHSRQFHKSIPDKACWECHPAHTFTVHR